MTYLSHPVRRMRDEPRDESVALVLRLGDVDSEGVESRVEAVGGEVDAELAFETLRVVVPQESVADLCEIDGLDAIETAATLGIGSGDAEEDMELDDS
ncbi:hypothetical protein ACFFQF_14010 [Haladaptatus pallidirubidus]|uniref:Putative peptidase inhibitor domain-containing protein n=1 Tax=Haladaptatus pallidirubidus TaxID=1008152 RepID=A0AAV3UDK1_9EURY|nr:hypothetical protein [Haladaptatus pallidirubidus]